MIYFISLIAFGIIAGFFISMVGIPVGFEWLNPVMMCVIAGLSFVPLIMANGKRGVWILFMLGLTGFLIEYIAIGTCYPYGCFHYGDLLGYMIRDRVPWTVLIARSPLLVGIATLLKPYTQTLFVDQKPRLRQGLFFLLATIILVLCDMVLDPGAVLFGFWTFVGGHPRYHIFPDYQRYNVPWTNFLGWVISGFVGFMVRAYRQNWYRRVTQTEWTMTNYDADALLVMIVFWTTVGWMKVMRGPALLGTVLCVMIGYGVAKMKKIG